MVAYLTPDSPVKVKREGGLVFELTAISCRFIRWFMQTKFQIFIFALFVDWRNFILSGTLLISYVPPLCHW